VALEGDILHLYLRKHEVAYFIRTN